MLLKKDLDQRDYSVRLRSLLSLPAGIEPVTALCIGHSGVKYYRRVPRNAVAVDYV